jgi:hypothetical protein
MGFDQLDIVAALARGTTAGPYAGLAAASPESTVPVPEPTTWALLALGILIVVATVARPVPSSRNDRADG